VRPIKLLDGECEVNEVFFDNVEVPAENLIGEENKGWTYAKHLLSHERTNIADVNRAKRELERLKRIAKAEGVYDDTRFRDEIAKLEVDVVALEMLVLRVLSAEKSGKNSLDIAGLLKIRGSEIQQRYSELMMLAAGPYSLPFIKEAMEAGWQGDRPRRWALGGVVANAPLAATYFNMRKTTIYGGSNEVQRNIVAHRRCWAKETQGTWISIFLTTRNNCATPCASGWTRATTSSAAARPPRPAALTAPPGRAGRTGPDRPVHQRSRRRHGHGPGRRHGGDGRAGPRHRAGAPGPGADCRRRAQRLCAAPVKDAWLAACQRRSPGGAGPPGAQGALPAGRLRRKSHASRRRMDMSVTATKSMVPAGDQADAFLVPRSVANGKIALFLVERSAPAA
jgi:hypothetical protein